MTDSTALQAVAQRTGANLLPDNDQWRFRFEIRSANSSRLYVVAQRKSDGTWGCSCMGWKAHRHCRHLDEMGTALRSLR